MQVFSNIFLLILQVENSTQLKKRSRKNLLLFFPSSIANPIIFLQIGEKSNSYEKNSTLFNVNYGSNHGFCPRQRLRQTS